MGSIGRVLSFQISSWLFLGSALFFVAYIVCSILVIHSYIELRRTSLQNSVKYGLLEDENSANRKLLGKSRQHIALLEGYIQHLEGGTDFSIPVKRGQTQNDGERISSQDPSDKTPKSPQIVDATDMVIQKEGSSMSVNLRLVNVQPGEGAVGGYFHIIAIDRKAVPPKEWPYPQGKLEKGMPANYRKGQIFLIQKFKQVNVKFHLGGQSESPSAIKVLVYDQAGEVLLQKEMEVTHAS